MSKEKKNNGKEVVKKERRVVILDDAKKESVKAIISELIKDGSFPKISDEVVKKVVENRKVNEKTLKAFCSRIEKFALTISRGKKEKKGKEVDEALQKEIKEASLMTASTLAQKLFKSNITFEKLLVLKKGKKEANAYGKVIFKMEKSGKRHFLCWDYKNGDLFVGSTLHEYTEEIKKNGDSK